MFIDQEKEEKKIKAPLIFSLQTWKSCFEQLDVKMAIKTALAVIFSLYLCLELDYYLKHPENLITGLWCVISAIVVLQANLGGTYKAIWNRFVGIIIGSIIGTFFTVIFGAATISIGSAVFFTIILCSFLNVQDSYRIASLSVAVIMIPWQIKPTIDPWIFALFRFIDTCVGFIVAIFISNVLWPSKALQKLHSNIAETCTLLRQFYEHLLIPGTSLYKSLQISQDLLTDIDQSLLQNRLILEESKIELLLRFTPISLWIDLINCQERLWESLYSLSCVMNSNLEEMFDEGLRKQVHQVIEAIDLALKELAVEMKTGKQVFQFNALSHLQDSLNQELIRFRQTRATKRYSLEAVENYFVFFYQLRQISTVLQNFNHLTEQLKTKKEASILD